MDKMGALADAGVRRRAHDPGMTRSLDARTTLAGLPLRVPPESVTERVETVIVGAGQAGLSLGRELARRGRPFVILEACPRVGDVWRNRFDALRLYSPARYDGLPGMRFPADPWSFPTKDEVGDYLETYAREFELPVRTGVAVDSLTREGDGYVIHAGQQRFEAANVVVASGTWQMPVTPEFAGALDPSIRQMHSHDYRNPGQLQPGPVLVVGAGHSGSDIAYDVARAGHPTTLSGRIHGEIPFRIDGRPARAILPVLFFLAKHVLTLRTPIGRRMSTEVRGGGGPLLRIKRADLAEAGVEHTPARVAGVEGGKPALDDGRVLDVANVVWCTGFRKDTSWIGLPVTGEDGWPEQKHGVAASWPGLYFVGLPFLQAFASMLVGGVGRDAERVAKHIARRGRRI
jgi:putative flavoprotein involved in K+ transport